MSEKISAKEQARYQLTKVEALRRGAKEAAKRPREQPWRPEAEAGADSQFTEPVDRAGFFLEGVIQTTLKHCNLATSHSSQMGPN